MAFDEKPLELFSLEAEQAVLGAVLFDNSVMGRVADYLRADHFYDPVHQLIFLTASTMIDAGKMASPLTIDLALSSSPGYIEAKGRSYLEQIAGSVPTLASAGDFAKIVADLAVRRALAKEADDLAAALRSSRTGDLSALLDASDAKIAKALERPGAARLKTVADAVSESLAKMQTAADGAGVGLRCGLSDLDERIGGFRRGKLYIIGGRPGQGKSTLLNKLAAGIAETTGEGVAIFTLEMEAADLPVMWATDRMRDRCIRLPYLQAEKGIFAEDEWAAFETALREVTALPILIDDTPSASLAHIRRFARRARRSFLAQGKRLGAIVVDYLGLIEKSRELHGTERVAEITQGLLALARELDCAILCGCQLNRQLESRDDKRPHLSDLRESGDIEQDAFAVLFVYREAYYHERSEPKSGAPMSKDAAKHEAWALDMDRLKVERPLEVIVAKHRRGPTGTVTLWCEIETAAIRNKGFNLMDPTGRDKEGFI